MSNAFRSLLVACAMLSIAAGSAGCKSTTTSLDAGTVSSDGGSPSDPSKVTGTLSTLGAAQPIVSSYVISNRGETLIYLTTSPITCTTLQASRWSGSTAAGSQIIEFVMQGAPTVGQTVAVPPGEVNYVPGAMSSANEMSASSGSFMFTRADHNGTVQGYVTAAFDDGTHISGTFNAEFCANGMNY